MDEKLLAECEKVAWAVEAEVERFFLEWEDAEGPIALHDGTYISLFGPFGGKSVSITIHVQPAANDPYWAT